MAHLLCKLLHHGGLACARLSHQEDGLVHAHARGHALHGREGVAGQREAAPLEGRLLRGRAGVRVRVRARARVRVRVRVRVRGGVRVRVSEGDRCGVWRDR